MQSGTPKVFISYCHEDADRDILDMIVSSLEKYGNEAIYDGNLKIGDDIEKFMNLLESCDCVIILCTPKYGEKISDRRGGVYEEYKRIVNKHDEMWSIDRDGQQESGDDNTNDFLENYVRSFRKESFSICPILISGKADSSIPREFRSKLWADFTGMTTTTWRRTGDIVPQKNFRNMFDECISQISSSARDVLEFRKREFQRNSAKIFNKIFYKLKHDTNTISRENIEKLFVKTIEFNQINNQSAYILIGRKGSGKSTIADFLSMVHDGNRKSPIMININRLPLEYIYSIVIGARNQSDFFNVIQRNRLMQFAWEGLIHLACFEAIRLELAQGTLPSRQLRDAHVLQSHLERVERGVEDEGVTQLFGATQSFNIARRIAFFVHSVSTAVRYIDHLIQQAPDQQEKFDHFIGTRVSSEYFLSFMFGQNVLSAFNSILGRCERNFMIAMDGFDAEFQRFRQRSLDENDQGHDRHQRVEFEIDWLKGLMGAVRRYTAPDDYTPLSNNVDFCFTVPKDRFLEALKDDRDAYEFEGSYLNIDWTGPELSILLRKRIEYYKGFPSEKGLAPILRLDKLLEMCLPNFPRSIPIRLDTTTKEISTFNYVLRHSFWRPRDVLFYWARLIASYENYVSKGIDFTDTTIRSQVARSTRAIIENEFFKEFGGYVINIRELVDRFEGSQQVMSRDVFNLKLRGIHPVLAGDAEATDTSSQIDSLELLYKLGFIGFFVPPGVALGERYDTRWIFTFNEGDGILRDPVKRRRDTLQIVIHPIFVEYLGLEPYKKSLVCDYSDEYLIKHEIRAGAAVL